MLLESTASSASTPATPALPAKRAATPLPGGTLKKKRGRESGADALLAFSSTMERFNDDSRMEVNQSTPRRRKAAISYAEKEEELSDDELLDAVEMFHSDTSIADSYMSLANPSARTKYLKRMLEKSSKQ